MCGIVGYIGPRDATPIILEGLHRLEYRGYDSAGIAVMQNGGVALRREDVSHPLDGFGMLTPSTEQRPLLGVLWTSSIWTDRAPADTVLLRCMSGEESWLGLDHDEIVRRTCAELDHLYGLRGKPVRSWVFPWRQAIAEYEVGHLARLAALDTALSRTPGLVLAGSSYHGIAVNASMKDAARVADAGEILALARGDLLFEAGQPADCIYLLLDGAIEIVRPTDESTRPVPVAYITPGELIGEMALMTGTPRRSDARVPESARIWRLDRDRFEELTTELGSYGFELARMYARRLQEIITHMRRQARRKELSGKLQYFDMPTVVQTLLTTGQAGILTFTRETGEVFAEVERILEGNAGKRLPLAEGFTVPVVMAVV